MNIYETRLKELRSKLKDQTCDGFIVPMADEYQSEYVPASAQRINYLSGFAGSAGTIVVLLDKAAFFTDGRYTLQAEQQIPRALYEIYDTADKTPLSWLLENLTSGKEVGFDPWLHTAHEVERITLGLEKIGVNFLPLSLNPVNEIWIDRPSVPLTPVVPHDIVYSGKSSQQKRHEIAAQLKSKGIGATVITDPASVAWLLNIRGNDVPNTPLPLSFALLDDEGRVSWFVDPRKTTPDIHQYLGTEVSVLSPTDFEKALEKLGASQKLVRIDRNTAASWIFSRLRSLGAKINEGDDPCLLPKACKNATELEGMRAAHRRDGIALIRFLAWLDSHLASGEITEISAAEKLEAFRTENNLFRGPSFDTISGAGSHGAIVHYRAVANTNRRLELGQVYLLDSGGQYLDGTTDVTRTLGLGPTDAETRDRFTRVLKGHIALAAIKFPEGTTGSELDVLARQYLWEIGLDYAHGTGHGVGSYLGVHEGPQGISRRNKVPLQPGMIVSNEPGFYKQGHFGIRIENLQTVIDTLGPNPGEKKMLGFETLTLVPIDRHLMNLEMLTKGEREWINLYHGRVKANAFPLVDQFTKDWLEIATAPLH